MQVTIIGSGNMARGIGARLTAGGHEVTTQGRGEVKNADDIVILAVPYSEIDNVAKEYGDLSRKIVVDITNPVDFATFQLIPEPGKSGAEEVAKLFPQAKVVKAFNTIFNKTLEAGTVDGQELDVLMAGNDEDAKDTLKELVQTSGMRGLDVGPLANARHLEGLGLIHMALQDQLGTRWKSAVKFIG
ncbi:MAG: NADPH-dependent F420 reductase [Candidatus Saccharimonadales bacterium]